MGNVKIQESTIDLQNGQKGRVAVLTNVGEENPTAKLDWAVAEYVGNAGYNQFVDVHADNPYMRVIISGINEMSQEDFDPLKHKLQS